MLEWHEAHVEAVTPLHEEESVGLARFEVEEAMRSRQS